ncbi:diguanylate cyclase/phosphodiesterase [Pseudoxanthomonas sp. GM95]|nr:diguanylate cyclase/phosphodiesterase [Pseudoxanthomonas sp. GM95]
MLRFGLLLAAALAIGLGYWVVSDRRNRLEGAERQSQALVAGLERVITLELRNIERAMGGISSDAHQLMASVPDQAPRLISESIAGVVSRHHEIQSIVLVDHDGTALTTGQGDPGFAGWIDAAAHGDRNPLRFGQPYALASGRWVLPIALPMPADGDEAPSHWLLTRLYTDELQAMVDGLDTGRDGLASVVGPGDVLLARSLASANNVVGRHVAGPSSEELHNDGTLIPERTSEIDGLRRVVAVRLLKPYPLQVWAGLSTREALVPWFKFVGAALVLYLLYWAMLLVMLRAVRRADRDQRELLHHIQRNSEHLRLAQHTGKVGAWALEHGSGHLAWGGDISSMFGLGGEETSSLRSFGRHVHLQDRGMLWQRFVSAWRSRSAFSSEFRLVSDDGTERWVVARGGVVEDDHGHLRMTGTLVDISERMEAMSRVTDAERQFRLIFDRNPLPFWVHDARTQRFLEVNRAASLQYGFSREEFLTMQLRDICPGGLREPGQLIQGAAAGFDDAHVSQHRRKDGSTLQARIHGSEIRFGGQDARLVLAEDVSERIEYEKELAYRARHDQTTGLINVQTLSDRLDQGVYPGYQVVYLQLRGLQPIRDSLGRETADNVLRTLAARLQQWADDFGLAAHQPDEDFVLAIVHPHHAAAAIEAAIEAVREPIGDSDGSMQRLDARFGLAEEDGSGQRAERIIDNAALAAHALESAAFEIARYDGALARRYSDRLRMAARLRTAIEQNEFELHFQPIVRVADGSVAALEALVRWPQRDGTDIPPNEFIPLCEDTGLIVPLGSWILRRAAQAQAWLKRQGCGDLPVAVNVSAVQMLQADLAGELELACTQAGISPLALHMELTETVLMNRPEQGMAIMQRLRDAGVCISLDDFGTGFSSMSYLRHLPLSSIKLDRTFVCDVDRDPRNASICRALLQLGHSLGLVMIAEGVERPEELEWLQRHGCDQVQGYLLGRPQPLELALQRVQGVAAR